MSDESDFQLTDDEFDDNKHAKIIENVLSLNKTQQLKKASRTEPTLQISEFNLVKSATGRQGSVEIEHLAKALKNRKKHAEIGKKIAATKKKIHTLPKPLEKPKADQIRRTVGYEKSRFLFDRWEAFITSNRAEAHQVFPLGSVKDVQVEEKVGPKISSHIRYKSNFQKEYEKLNSEVEEYHIEDENEKDEFPLTLKELKEKRQEAAKLRAHQSFKEAKARRQNKIKSKKYHRILRKERIKQKLKEFEELQKTDPEEALKKLGEIEKARALERFSLRHKSTGQWAKSKQVRAKYDKESRQILAQQLQISRDLTQKQKVLGSDSEDEGFVTEEASEPNISSSENPWIGEIKPDKDVSEFVAGYKKFWSSQNHVEKTDISKVNSDPEEDSNLKNAKNLQTEESEEKNCFKVEENKKTPKRKQSNLNHEVKKSKNKKTKANLNNSSGSWDIEDIFDNVERKIEEKLKKKAIKKQKKGHKKMKAPKKGNTDSKLKKKIDLKMIPQSKKQIIDEEMIEQPLNDNPNSLNSDNISVLKNILDDNRTKSKEQGKSENIDPEKFMKPKVTDLDSALPDLIFEEDNIEENNQKSIILEAFEDNDIVDDFTKEKQADIDKDKPKDIDLNLPGWGSWAGAGINLKKQRKRRRFIVKMPEVMPRRDDNKGSLIVNEKAAAKIKPHLVSEVPFPFKTVKDYEASIRAPIGNTFVPELAYRRYITPAIQTKMGAIIEPASTSILMGKRK